MLFVSILKFVTARFIFAKWRKPKFHGGVFLKNKLRKITVAGQNFIYWYSIGESFILNISPENIKTSKIMLKFIANVPDKDPVMFWVFYKIHAVKNNVETSILLTSPKNIAELISFLLNDNENLFIKGQTRMINNAMHLLNKMDYTNLNPVWEREW